MPNAINKQQQKLENVSNSLAATGATPHARRVDDTAQNETLQFPMGDRKPLLSPQQASSELQQHPSLVLNCFPDRQITELLRTGVRWNASTLATLSFDQGYGIVRNLTDTKVARVLGNLIAFEPEAVKNTFSRLAQESPKRAAHILLATKESPNQVCTFSPLEGTLASTLLQSCGSLTRVSVAMELKKSDPAFYHNVINRKSILTKLSQPEGTFVSSEKFPQPSAPIDRPLVIPREGEREVLLGEYCAATAKKTPVLTTSDISLCIAVAFYDQQTRLGILGHITPNTSVSESFDRMIGELRSHGVDPQAVEVKLIGGRQQGSEPLLYEIERRLKLEQMNVVERDVLQPRSQTPLHLSFDLSTGAIGRLSSASPEATSDQAAAWTQSLFTKGSKALSPHPESIVGSIPISKPSRQVFTSAQ